MKRFALVFLIAITAQAQAVFTASKTTSLSGAAEVITVQQPATGNVVTRFVSAYIDCSVACNITIERNGTAATATTLTPNPGNPSASALTTAWSGSNVGTGTVVTRASVAAGGGIVVDLSKIFMTGSGTAKNLSLRTNSITGTVNIVITYTESY